MSGARPLVTTGVLVGTMPPPAAALIQVNLAPEKNILHKASVLTETNPDLTQVVF